MDRNRIRKTGDALLYLLPLVQIRCLAGDETLQEEEDWYPAPQTEHSAAFMIFSAAILPLIDGGQRYWILLLTYVAKTACISFDVSSRPERGTEAWGGTGGHVSSTP